VSTDTWTHSQATAATIGEIAATLTGEIVTPDDPGWDEARLGWNLAADREPAFVAIPAEVADVVALVGFEPHRRCLGHATFSPASEHPSPTTRPTVDTPLSLPQRGVDASGSSSWAMESVRRQGRESPGFQPGGLWWSRLRCPLKEA
jgi:hypothetical protein